MKLGNVYFSDELDPVLTRAKVFAEACAHRAMAHVISGEVSSLSRGSIERLIADRLKDRIGQRPLSPASRSRISQRSIVRGVSLRSRLQFVSGQNGPLSLLSLESKESLAEQLKGRLFQNSANAKAPIDLTEYKQLLKTSFAALPNASAVQVHRKFVEASLRFAGSATMSATAPTGAAPAASSAKKPWTALRLEITKAQALDLVDELGVDWGEDHIHMGGQGTDTADSKIEVQPRSLGKFSQNKKTRKFKKGLRFAQFDLTRRPDEWVHGRAFLATVALAEKDVDGGFLDFLRAIWDALEGVVNEALTAALLAAIAGAGIGAASGSSAPIVGTVVGAVVGATLGFLVGLVFEMLEDDIFEPVSLVPLWLESPNAFSGSGKSLEIDSGKVDLERDGAKYRLSYRWVLLR